MGVWDAYWALNTEQRRVLRTKQIALNRRIDVVIGMLQPMAAYDRIGDKVRTRFGWTAGLCIPLALALFVYLPKGNSSSRVLGISLLAGVTAVMLLAGSAWLWSRGTDLSNNLREFILPVLGVFREDIDASQPLKLKLDLRPATSKEKLQKRSDRPPAGGYYKIVENFYLDPWVSAEMPLADGSLLRWRITDHVRQRRMRKRNPRGKIKTKTKYTTKTMMDVELRLRSDAYAVEASEGDRVKAGEKKKAIRVKSRQKREMLGGLDPRAFIDVVAGIYGRATPAK